MSSAYILVYRRNPITLRRLLEIEERKDLIGKTETAELNMLVCGKSEAAIKKFYVYSFGWTWGERSKGLEACCII